MKLRTIPLIASISLVVFAMGVFGFLGIDNKLLNLRIAHQRKTLEPDSQLSFPISKGTILLLLAVGAIGALSVHRKNNIFRNISQSKSPQPPDDLKFDRSFIPVSVGHFWLGGSHMKTLQALRNAIRGDANFIILTGDSGVGKSTLIQYLKKKLSPEYIIVEIGNKIQDAKDLFKSIAVQTGINKNFKSKGVFFIHFNQYIHSIHAESKKILLVLDDFMKINERLIKELTFLSTIKIQHQKILKILISGEDISFSPDELYNKSKNGSVVTCRLERLNRSETNSYINYMLAKNGIENSIFPQETIQNIFLYSRGSPREIDRICECALKLAHEQKLQAITTVIIEESCKELDLLRSGQDNHYRQITRKTVQAKALFDNFLSRLTTWKFFDPFVNFAHIIKQLAIGGFKKLAAQSQSSIQSATKNLYIKQRNYWHTVFFSSGLFDSYLWNSVLSVGLVALALVFSLWYQGILPFKPHAPGSDDLQKKYDFAKMDQEIFHGKKIIKLSKQLKIEAKKPPSTDQTWSSLITQNELKSELPVEEPKSAKGTYFVQVGAFLIKENANKAARMLKKKGYLATIVTFTDSRERIWHTVRIGQYASFKDAKKHAAEFSNQEKMDSIVLPSK
jgi:type II secretory pathway predicted ATPase ExeA